MVQFFNVGPSKKDLLKQSIGNMLSTGLSSFTSGYYANKALNEILNDKEYKNLPQSERTSKLVSALQPYGEYGKNILATRLGIEQQAEQEKQQKSLSRVLAKYQKGEPINENDISALPTDMQLEFLKASKPKAPPGGLSGQPVPPEISQKIPQILNAYRNANADQLAAAFDTQGIPRAYSNSYIENRRRQDESQTKLPTLKAELGIRRDSSVLEESDKLRSIIPTEEAALNAMEDAVIKGDQSFFSWDNLAEKTGFEWARTAQGGQFKTAAKTFLINNVSKFGARPNQYIEQQIADALAKVGRGKDANLASIALTRFDSDVKRKYLETLDRVEQEGNYPAGGLAREAQNRMASYVEQMQKELSNKLHVLATNDALAPGEVYVYDNQGSIVGTVNQDQIGELPEGYHVE